MKPFELYGQGFWKISRKLLELPPNLSESSRVSNENTWVEWDQVHIWDAVSRDFFEKGFAARWWSRCIAMAEV